MSSQLYSCRVLMPTMRIVPGMSMAEGIALIAVFNQTVGRIVLWVRANSILRLVSRCCAGCRLIWLTVLVILPVLMILSVLIVLLILPVLPRIRGSIPYHIRRIYIFNFSLQLFTAAYDICKAVVAMSAVIEAKACENQPQSKYKQ